MARMNCTTIDIAPKKHRTIFESDYTTVPTNGQRMKAVARIRVVEFRSEASEISLHGFTDIIFQLSILKMESNPLSSTLPMLCVQNLNLVSFSKRTIK